MMRRLLSLLVVLAFACAQIPTVQTRVGLEYQAGIPIPLTDSDSRVHSDPKTLALEFASVLNPHFQWVIKNLYKTSKNGVTHVYLRQVINGLEVANGDLNINFDRNGQVVSYGDSSFMPMGPLRLMEERITASEALKIVATKLCITFNNEMTVQPGNELYPFQFENSGISLDPVPWRTALIQSDEGRNLSQTHNFIVRTNDHWYDIHVDSHNGDILAKYDWASNSHFDVYAIPDIDPLLGARVNLLDPDEFAKQWGSPLGWNCQDTNKCFTTTIGNNVYAQTNPSGGPTWQNNYRPDGGSALNFVYAVDFKKQPTDYKDASTTNLFYWNNIMHDVFYAAGFDEVSGNFQENNFGKGGKAVDAVQANSQDGSGYNNANFATPPDGQRPRMRMYLWNAQTPMRDGDLDSGIIVHEYGHGISNRLTGGPANTNCLQTLQAGGMGEGWGDWWAIGFQMRETTQPTDEFPMGTYANFGKGIRPFPYTTDFEVDPQTYGYLNLPGYNAVHSIGSVWATILNEVYWELVDKYGFDPDRYTGDGGNNVIFQNVVDGLKLQPCNPTLINARDAIILADTQNYAGENVCDIWRAFARRGLGANAKTGTKVTEDFTLPSQCQ